MSEAEGVFRIGADADTLHTLREEVKRGDYAVLKNRDRARGLMTTPHDAARHTHTHTA